MGKSHVAIAVFAGCILQFILSLADWLFHRNVMSIGIKNTSMFLLLSPFIGNILGCSLFCFLSDIIGRKKTLVSIVLILITSCASGIIYRSNKDYIMICVVGITQGMSFGGAFAVLPIYLCEIAEKSSRGMIISISHSMLTLGSVIVRNVSSYVEIDIISNTINYGSILLGLLTVLTFGLLATESPLYHIKKGRERSAQKALKKLRCIHNDTQLELDDLQGTTEDRIDNNTNNEKVMTCLKSNGLIKTLVIMFCLTISHCLCGVYLIQFYLLVSPYGLSLLNYEIGFWLLDGISLLSSLVCAFAVDRIGRKMCLLISFVGMAASVVYFCVIRALMSNNIINESPSFYFAFTILFYAAYNYGAAQIPSILIAEIFPLNTKMLMSAILTVTFALSKIAILPVAVWQVPVDTYLYINIISCIISVMAIHFLFLETSQKSFHEIQLALKRF